MCEQFTVLDDRVVVAPYEAPSQTSNGIFIPEASKEKPIRGRVIAVGPGRRSDSGERMPLAVQPGNSVIYGRYAGTELKLDGVTYLILRESEIMLVLPAEPVPALPAEPPCAPANT